MTTTISGLPIHTGTGTPEALLSGDIYAHALGQSVRQWFRDTLADKNPIEDEVAEEVMKRLKAAREDLYFPPASNAQATRAETNQESNPHA